MLTCSEGMEEIWIINDEIVIETWRETESELEIIVLGLEEKELKTKGSLNGDINVSLPINTQRCVSETGAILQKYYQKGY